MRTLVEQDIGIIGLGVMGHSIALNFHNHHYSVAVYNRTEQKTREFVQSHPEIYGTYSINDFVNALSKPRKILLMMTAGPAIDATIANLVGSLSHADILMDGGNSYFQDTERRFNQVEKEAIHYLGIGVSGGEEGALKGPCLMAGGSREGFDHVRAMLSNIAAQADGTCCQFLGSGGAGHYVKMVHNGIEYAIIQIIAEAYDLLTRGAGFTNQQVHVIFKNWSTAKMNSFLMEIATEVLSKKDQDTKLPIVSVILDRAQQKGTGKWTSQNAMDLGIPTPTIDASVTARNISALKDERTYASTRLKGPRPGNAAKPTEQFAEALGDAAQASIIISYAQGFHLMRAASEEYRYNIPFAEVARIWKGGCIIRAKLLDQINHAYNSNPSLQNLLLDPEITATMSGLDNNWREAVVQAKKTGIPISAIDASLDYYDSYRSEHLPANMIQALRDRFGSHGYERTDKPGHYHTNWSS
jgi:6-phosphogluconate dehydrogenase